MANELATGYVSIVADTRGFGAAIDREFARVEASGAKSGRRLGEQVKKGIEAAKPVDTAELEHQFTLAERRREDAVKKSTASIEALRRKEAIAQQQLTEAEAKYAADSSQVLRAKDRLATASDRVRLAEAKQTVDVKRATDAVAEAKSALDAAKTANDQAAKAADSSAQSHGRFGTAVRQAFSGVASQARGMAGSARESLGQMSRGFSDTFRKLGSGDIRGAFDNVKSMFSGLGRSGKDAGEDTGKRFSRSLDAEMKSAGKVTGVSFGTIFKSTILGSGLMSVISGIGSTIKSAFGGGIDRLMNIEAAEVKLKAVGADVGAAMKSVSASVEGTRFALSDAADMAAVLSGSGIEAGAEMERWLKLTANAAQFNNAEFSEMQAIIQRVAQEGRVTGETFQSLPIAASALAEHLGISQEEVRKLASQGKISAEDFAAAMEKTMGNAAELAGGTFSSMLANLRTAFSATMANLIGPVMDGLKPILEAGLGLAKGFRDQVSKPMGEALGEFLQPRAEAFAEFLSGLPGKLSEVKSILSAGDFTGAAGWEEDSPIVGFLFTIRDTATKVRESVGGLFDSLKEALGGFLDGFGGDFDGSQLMSLVTLFSGPLGIIKTLFMELSESVDLGALFTELGAALRPIADLAASVGAQLGGVLGEAFASLAPVLADLVKTLLPQLAGLFQQLAPHIGELVGIVANLVSGTVLPLLLDLFQTLVPALLPIITSILPVLAPLLGMVAQAVGQLLAAVLPLVAELIGALVPVIAQIVATVLPPLMGVLGQVAQLILGVVVPVVISLVQTLSSILIPIIQFLAPLVGTIFGFIANTIKNALNIVSGIIKTVMSIIKGDWSGAWEGIKQIASALWDQIENIVRTAIDLVKGVITGGMQLIRTGWDAAWNGIKDAATSFVDGIKWAVENGFDTMVKAVGKIWDDLKAMVAKPVNFVIDVVWNEGLRKLIGLLPGVPEPPAIKKIQGFDRGGWTGPGGRLDPAGIVHADEFVIKKASRGRFERKFPGFLKHINDTGTLPGYAGGGAVRPVRQGHSGWNGGRYRSGGYHGGLDFPAPIGTPVGSMWAGAVVKALRLNRSYGHHVQVSHGNGLSTLYAHLSQILVRVGQQLSAGQMLGRVGSTGNSTGPHLHLEVRSGGRRLNPEPYLSGAARPSGDQSAVHADDPSDIGLFQIPELVGKITSGIKENLTGPWGEMLKDGLLGLVDKVKEWALGKIGFANGTTSAPRGWSWVGERGPELMFMRGGETVIPHRQSVTMMRESTYGGAQTVINYAPVLPPDADPRRQYEQFSWELVHDAQLSLGGVR